MPKINNPRYNEFIKKGHINTILPEEFKQKLKQIKSKYQTEAEILFITLYYTGARPAEVLQLKAKDIKKEQMSYLVIQMSACKNGLPRPIRLKYRNEEARKIYKYSIGLMEEMYLFPHFRSHTIKTVKWKTRKGEPKEKEYTEISNKIKYHFKKWFGGDINPYFLRHNRFSNIMERGGTAEDILLLKGAKSMESVRPYAHLSKRKSINIAKMID